MGEPANEFAQHLRSLREAQGLSVRALANLIGVSKVTVWKWEKGDSKPRARMLAPLAKALDVAPPQLRLAGGLAEGITDRSAVSGLSPAMSRTVPDARDGGEPGLQGQPESPSEPPGAELLAPQSLADVIAQAKRMIAEASGVGTRNVTISIEY